MAAEGGVGATDQPLTLSSQEQTSDWQFNSQFLCSCRPPTYLRLAGLFFLLGLDALLA